MVADESTVGVTNVDMLIHNTITQLGYCVLVTLERVSTRRDPCVVKFTVCVESPGVKIDRNCILIAVRLVVCRHDSHAHLPDVRMEWEVVVVE
jgi:hypothetical protein